jgi:hypothetical protein
MCVYYTPQHAPHEPIEQCRGGCDKAWMRSVAINTYTHQQPDERALCRAAADDPYM